MDPSIAATHFTQKNSRYDYFGYFKSWFAAKQQDDICQKFYETPESFAWVIAVPGFTENHLKSVKISRRIQEEAFYIVLEGVRNHLQSYKEDKEFMPPAMEEKFLVMTQDIVPLAKLEEFSGESIKNFTSGLLLIVWKRKYVANEL